MIEELVRHRCIGDDGTPLFVVEHRHVFTSQGGAGPRQHRGAAWATLLNDEPVRYIDARTFEVVATGGGACPRSAAMRLCDRCEDCDAG